jgi:hypothetical protein
LALLVEAHSYHKMALMERSNLVLIHMMALKELEHSLAQMVLVHSLADGIKLNK